MKLLPGTITHSWLPASKEGAAGGEGRGRGCRSWAGMEEAEEGEEAGQEWPLPRVRASPAPALQHLWHSPLLPSELCVGPVAVLTGSCRGLFIFPSELSGRTSAMAGFGRAAQPCWSFLHGQVTEMILDNCWWCHGM